MPLTNRKRRAQNKALYEKNKESKDATNDGAVRRKASHHIMRPTRSKTKVLNTKYNEAHKEQKQVLNTEYSQAHKDDKISYNTEGV